MTLSPPSLEDGRGKGARKRDDDRHEQESPNQDQDMSSTSEKGRTSHPQPEGGTRTTMYREPPAVPSMGQRLGIIPPADLMPGKAGHLSSPAILPPMKADDGGPRVDLGALDLAPDPLRDIGQRRGYDDNMGAGKLKIDDGGPCGSVGALDAAPSQPGDTGQGQGQYCMMRTEKMTYPCPAPDGQLYVRTTAHDEVPQYLGLSADTARPPGLPKSPPPYRGRRQE